VVGDRVAQLGLVVAGVKELLAGPPALAGGRVGGQGPADDQPGWGERLDAEQVAVGPPQKCCQMRSARLRSRRGKAAIVSGERLRACGSYSRDHAWIIRLGGCHPGVVLLTWYEG